MRPSMKVPSGPRTGLDVRLGYWPTSRGCGEDQYPVGARYAAADMALGDRPKPAGGDDPMHFRQPLLQGQHLGFVHFLRRGGLVHGMPSISFGRYFAGATISPSFCISGLNCASCSAKKRVNSARFCSARRAALQRHLVGELAPPRDFSRALVEAARRRRGSLGAKRRPSNRQIDARLAHRRNVAIMVSRCGAASGEDAQLDGVTHRLHRRHDSKARSICPTAYRAERSERLNGTKVASCRRRRERGGEDVAELPGLMPRAGRGFRLAADRFGQRLPAFRGDAATRQDRVDHAINLYQ